MIISSYLKLPKSTNLIITVLPPSVYGISHNDWRVLEVLRVGDKLMGSPSGGGRIWAEAVRPGAENPLVIRAR